jgi:hypothetical protein
MPHDTPAAFAAAREREEQMTGEMTFIPDIIQQYAPKYVIYIFNIGPITHSVEKGSAGPRGGYRIEACEKGKPFSRPLILPSLVTDTYMIENEIKTHSVSGEFMAQDIVHPMLGRNWSLGQNLDELGVFWTKNNPPTDQELSDARAKLDKTFRALLAEATQLEATGQLQNVTPLMRYAADWSGEDRPWNKIYKTMAECPACGNSVKPGVVIHTCGAVMPGMWARAVAMGLKTRQQAEAAAEAEAAIEGNFGVLANLGEAQEDLGSFGIASEAAKVAEDTRFDKPDTYQTHHQTVLPAKKAAKQPKSKKR